ncbi:MAG: hypothetical protein MRY32_01110, partial [Rickettsiales bacterium]|nr:hypothetical protein [Rickettsiales bacterium]
YSASEPTDNDSTVLFLNNYSSFAGNLLKAQTIKIQADFYKQGANTFEFNVSKFSIEKYKTK